MTHAGWAMDPHELEYLLVRTCGYWVGMDASCIRLACSVTREGDELGQVADVSVIPIACIMGASVHEH